MGLTLNVDVWKPDYIKISNEGKINVYLHTVNDPTQAKMLLNDGVKAVYTDFLNPKDLEG